MTLKPSLLRVFYKATEQRIKVFEGTPKSSIYDIIKRSFHIEDDISKIFLQDEDGDLIVLPPQIPDGLCVYVYVEPSLTPKTKLQIHNQMLQREIPNPIPDPPFQTSKQPILPENHSALYFASFSCWK